jgi:hypothetical protein
MPKQGEHNVRILNKEFITSIEIVKQPEEIKSKDKLRFDKEVQYMITNPDSSSESKQNNYYDVSVYKRRGERNVEQVLANACLVGNGVEDSAQALFNRLSNMFLLFFIFFFFLT